MAAVGVSSGFQAKPERLELIHADSLKYDKSTETVRYLGNVFFRKGTQRLTCDQAVHYRKSRLTVLTGRVDFEDESMSLLADYFEHHETNQMELARGNVILTEKEKSISCDELTYFGDRKFANASGNVRYFESENKVELTCQKLTYDRLSKIAVAEVNPVLTRFDEKNRAEVTIKARQLSHNDSTRIATAQDSARIVRRDIQATSNLCRFFLEEDRIALTGDPHVKQNQRHMTAEEIELFIENDSLRQVYLNGKGSMRSGFLLEGRQAHDRLTGAEIWIDVQRDSVKTIRVKGQATSFYHLFEEGKVKGLNQVLGDELSINFENGEITQVTVTSSPDVSKGRFYPPGARVSNLN